MQSPNADFASERLGLCDFVRCSHRLTAFSLSDGHRRFFEKERMLHFVLSQERCDLSESVDWTPSTRIHRTGDGCGTCGSSPAALRHRGIGVPLAAILKISSSFPLSYRFCCLKATFAREG